MCKPAGFHSQRTPYQLVGTVEHAVSLLFRARGLREPVRLAHRLDKGTSGVMFFPLRAAAAAQLSGALHDGLVEKVYLALVEGVPPGMGGTVEAPIAALGKSRFAVRDDGRPARTDWRLVAAGDGASLVEARPRTGRTHQIRLHLESLGCPVAGDDRYGPESGVCPYPRMMLHCLSMSFSGADGRSVAASAPLDSPFVEACQRARIDPAALAARGDDSPAP